MAFLTTIKRALIAYDTGEKICGVYCHLDGYPSSVGRILYSHYLGDIDKVKKLISLGDFSNLRDTVDKTKLESYRYKNAETTYIRDYNSIDGLLEEESDGYIEYVYLFSEDCKTMAIYGVCLPFNLKNLTFYEKEVIFKNGFSEEDFEYKYGAPLEEITEIRLEDKQLNDFQHLLLFYK